MNSAIDERFPVKDITFTSGRMQGYWEKNEVTSTEGYFVEQEQQVSTTLESVIKYLRNRKTVNSEIKIMQAVINYLEEYRMLKIELRHKEESAENETGNEESDTTVTDGEGNTRDNEED